MARGYHKCKNCKREFTITTDNVIQDWVTRGYDGDYKAYLVRCLKCNQFEEISFFKLPIKVMCHFIRK